MSTFSAEETYGLSHYGAPAEIRREGRALFPYGAFLEIKSLS